MNQKLLITGFDPFGGSVVNPSWLAVEALPDEIGTITLRKLQIPTIFGQAAARALAVAEEFQPDVILCVGVAGGRDSVTPERIAVNIRDARIPDNAGFQPQGESVDPAGPAAYFSTLPVREIAQAIREKGIPAVVSNTAGTFVCNDTLYTLLHHFSGSNTRVGFVHIPNLPDQGSPSLPLDQSTAALTAAIRTCFGA